MSYNQKSDGGSVPPRSPQMPLSSSYKYYDDLDEFGNDQKLPPSLVREFVYEPNILSEELVRLQRFIHDHHQTVENYVDRTADGLFFAERKTLQGFRWLREDAPRLVVPTLQVGVLAYTGYFANRFQPISMRLLASSSLGIMTAFLVYPAWRKGTIQLLHEHVVEPWPPVQEAVRTVQKAWDHTVLDIVTGWNAYDRTTGRIRDGINDARNRIISFFKPGRSRRGD